MTSNDIATLPDADAEQRHLMDEIEHPAEYAAFQHEFAALCGACGQPLPNGKAGRPGNAGT